MNTIFLDIDGVLTSPRVHLAYDCKGVWHHFDPVACRMIAKLASEFNAQIVISSTWRMGKTREHMVDLMNVAHPNFGNWVAKGDAWFTPLLGGPRGTEICQWLRLFPLTGRDQMVIIDDDSDMGGLARYLVKTDPHNGMLFEHYLAAAQLLMWKP